MLYPGRPAAEQCEGCTFYTTQVSELSQLHSRGATYATFCQGPYEESVRYHEFMGWGMPWYSAQGSLDALLVGPGGQIPPGVLSALRGSGVRDLLDQRAWRRGDALQQRAARPDGVRPAGDLGGLARQLAARRRWGRPLGPHERTSHRPVVPLGSRALGRSPECRGEIRSASASRRLSLGIVRDCAFRGVPGNSSYLTAGHDERKRVL